MELSREVIEYAIKEVDVAQYVAPAEAVTANHILYKQFIERTKWKGLPKIIFYLLMDNKYGPPCVKDNDGYLGYKLSILNTTNGSK